MTYEEMCADEAEMDKRIVDQLQAAGKPVYAPWDDPEEPDRFYIRVRYSATETNDLVFETREGRDESLAVLLAGDAA